MSAYLRTELVPAARLQPGDVVTGSWGLRRTIWAYTPPGGDRTTLWWPDTSRVYLPADLPVLMVSRPRPPHHEMGPERTARIRSAALGATWLRHIGHPGAPVDVVYSITCVAYSKIVGCGPDVPSELLLAVLTARAQLHGPGEASANAETPGICVQSWN